MGSLRNDSHLPIVQTEQRESRSFGRVPSPIARLAMFKRRPLMKHGQRGLIVFSCVNALCASVYLFAMLKGGTQMDEVSLGPSDASEGKDAERDERIGLPMGSRVITLEVSLADFSESELSSRVFDLLFVHPDEGGVPRVHVIYRNIYLVGANVPLGSARVLISEDDVSPLVALAQIGAFKLVLSGGDDLSGATSKVDTTNGKDGAEFSIAEHRLSDRQWVAEALRLNPIEVIE